MLSFSLGSPPNTTPGGLAPAPAPPPTAPPFYPVPPGLKHIIQLMPSLAVVQAAQPPAPQPPTIPESPPILAPSPQTPPAPPVPPPLETTPAPVPVAPPPFQQPQPAGPVLPGVESLRRVPTWVWWAGGITLAGAVVGIVLSR